MGKALWEEKKMADMKKEREREELHKAIWSIADDLRGSVDGWDFKNYVLGTMFYRYISEDLTAYINQERSVSATAKDLFVHKNTLLYRLNQIYAYIPKEEFDSPYCRDYIRLSIYYLTEQVINDHT